MGWTGSSDPVQILRFDFESKEEAVNFAISQGNKKFFTKSYSVFQCV